MLNDYFPHIFCINLDRREDRLARFDAMAKANDFTYTRWPAVDGRELRDPNGNLMEENERRRMELACKVSHARLIRYAKSQGMSHILVFEDDAVLDKGWEAKIHEPLFPSTYGLGIEINETHCTADWHMLYLGVNDINGTKEILTDNICRIRTGFTTHAYAINSTAYDLALNAFDMRGQADVLYADYIHPLGHSYAFHPNICHQADGFSDITLKDEKYTLK
jgi:GR25 family glycosyltransferase involved in LPS biosynthesis